MSQLRRTPLSGLNLIRRIATLSCVAMPCVFALLVQNLCAQEPTPQPEAPVVATTPGEISQHLILIIGAPGTEEYAKNFQTWAGRWEDAARRAGIPCTVIGKSAPEAGAAKTSAAEPQTDSPPSADPAVTESPKESQHVDAKTLEETISSFGNVTSPEPLWIVYIGHGTYDGRTASWNLRGSDVTAEQLATVCRNLQRPLATVVCSSCSSPFINVLSGPGRVVVTATKDGNEIQYCRFGDAMSVAISTLDADINRDGQTSLLEAWLFASRRTAEFYTAEGRLATEHSLLDDNGDSKGVRAELYNGDRIVNNAEQPELIDGRTAARWHFVRSDEERRLSPEQREKRDALEFQLEELRQQKAKLSEEDYLKQVEVIAVQLAEIYEAAGK